MSEHVFFIFIGLPLTVILLIFAMKYVSATKQAQLKAAAQTDSTALLTAIQAELAQMNARVAAVEKILKTVE